MSPLGAAEWLDAWERSLDLPAALRPCALLAPLLPDGLDAVARLSIGERDAALFELHAGLFGPLMDATAGCPACGARQQFELDTRDLHQPAPAMLNKPLEYRDGPYAVRFRLPDSLDLASIAQTADPQQAEAQLLQRCCVQATTNGREVAATELPGSAISALTAAMAEADPRALTELVLRCADCGHAWEEALDIGMYLQEALGHWAERLLDQVHLLAAAYGWSEREILGLSPARRARYLARIIA